jgi:hypothetical protein
MTFITEILTQINAPKSFYNLRNFFPIVQGCDPHPNCEHVCHFDKGMSPQKFVVEEANGHNKKELDILLSDATIGDGTFGFVSDLLKFCSSVS